MKKRAIKGVHAKWSFSAQKTAEEAKMGKLDDYHDHWMENDDEIEELERQRDEGIQKEFEDETFRD